MLGVELAGVMAGPIDVRYVKRVLAGAAHGHTGREGGEGKGVGVVVVVERKQHQHAAHSTQPATRSTWYLQWRSLLNWQAVVRGARASSYLGAG